MRGSAAAFVGLLCAAARCAGEGVLLHGVPPDERAAFAPAPGGTFACRDGHGAIPAERVNDDYCDCRDGSDEPGTSACSAGRFYCANAGHFSVRLFASRVGDGICDCCDGSDEANNPHAACGDTCARLATRDLGEIEAQATALRSALEQHDHALRASQQVALMERDELVRLEGELAHLTHQIANVSAHVTALEDVERKRREEEAAARAAEAAANAPPPSDNDAAEGADDAADGADDADDGADDGADGADDGADDAEGAEPSGDASAHVDVDVGADAEDGVQPRADAEADPETAIVADAAMRETSDVPANARAADADAVAAHGDGGGDGEDGAAAGGDAPPGKAESGGGEGKSGGAWFQSWMRMDEPPPQQAAAAGVAEPASAQAAGSDADADGDDDAASGADADAGAGADAPDRDGEYGDWDDGYTGAQHDGGDGDNDDDEDGNYGERDDDWADESAGHDEQDSPAVAQFGAGGAIAGIASRVSSAAHALLRLVDGVAERAAPSAYHRLRVWAMRSAGVPLGELHALREQKRKLSERKREVDDRLRELRKGAALDVGPEGRFRALSRKCFKFDAPDYAYEFCPFDHVSQKQRGVEVAALGSWADESWVDGTYAQMRYKGGTRCWNGPARSTTVTLLCGPRAEIGSVSEPEMCSYAMSFYTPAACSPDALVELERLIAQLRGAVPAGKEEL